MLFFVNCSTCICFAVWKLFHQMVAVISIRVAFYIEHTSFNDINESIRIKGFELRAHHKKHHKKMKHWYIFDRNKQLRRKRRRNERERARTAKILLLANVETLMVFLILFFLVENIIRVGFYTVVKRNEFSFLLSSSICFVCTTTFPFLLNNNHNKLLKNTKKMWSKNTRFNS